MLAQALQKSIGVALTEPGRYTKKFTAYFLQEPLAFKKDCFVPRNNPTRWSIGCTHFYSDSIY